MMGWFEKKEPVKIVIDPTQRLVKPVPKEARFIDLEGAMARVNEETGKLEFLPRGPISIAVDKIGAYYDNTIIIFGNKIRVMETANQIAVKILEATR